MIDQLKQWLEAKGVQTYIDAAPRELARCAVIHPMPFNTVNGDSTELLDIEKFQIDLYAPARTDNILTVVRNALLDQLFMPDVIEPLNYLDEYNVYRAIVYVEVY